MSRNKKPSSAERRNRKQLNNQSRQTEYAQMEHGLRDDRAEKHFRHQAYGKFAQEDMTMNLSFIQMLIDFLIIYLCVYALVDRVMRCIEHCATEKTKRCDKMLSSLPEIELIEEGLDNEQEVDKK